MEDWEREGLRGANSGVRNQFEHIMAAVAEQRGKLPAVRAALAEVRATATAPDGSVKVTVDGSGMLTGVEFQPKALQRKPTELGSLVTETARAAALLAEQRNTEIIAPLGAFTESLPDLPDIVPGAPSFRESMPIEGRSEPPPYT